MNKYSIGEVSRLLNVKPHVIRYWEQEIPFLSTQKGLTGRRIFTINDVQILYRLRHLLYEKRFTIQGARNKIWEEINSRNVDIKSRIAEIRGELIEILAKIRKSGKDYSRLDGMIKLC
ncbi:MAG: MerR family transcriptional regulator [Spirochaetales bacterium]|nr:MerR family transcriptional regulator [Spirochaetales bacterium]